MITARTRTRHERWLLELTALPTAAGHETRITTWIERWVARRERLALTRDRFGNLFIRFRTRKGGRRGRRPPPLLITAHLDHPGFIVTGVHGIEVELEFRGGVQDPYFENAAIEIFGRGRPAGARITALDSKAVPFKRVTATLERRARVAPGDIGRFRLDDNGPIPRIEDGRLYSYACDDLAAVVAALAAMDVLQARDDMAHVGLIFTRAEEIGFVGAIAAARSGSIPADARLICLENSRSFTESPVGAGPIARVGDRLSVFEPGLTNAVGLLMMEYDKTHPGFRWQRKLMPGGACEATAFSAYGYASTCLCLPLGNYHNMIDIDAVAAGARPARVGPEFVSVDDFHGLVDMLVICADGLDREGAPQLRARMEALFASHGAVVGASSPRRPSPSRLPSS